MQRRVNARRPVRQLAVNGSASMGRRTSSRRTARLASEVMSHYWLWLGRSAIGGRCQPQTRDDRLVPLVLPRCLVQAAAVVALAVLVVMVQQLVGGFFQVESSVILERGAGAERSRFCGVNDETKNY